jgi:hypothetical protein
MSTRPLRYPVLVLGDDRYDAWRWKQLEDFVVFRVRKGPVLNDASTTCHLDDETTVVRYGRA